MREERGKKVDDDDDEKNRMNVSSSSLLNFLGSKNFKRKLRLKNDYLGCMNIHVRT